MAVSMQAKDLRHAHIGKPGVMGDRQLRVEGTIASILHTADVVSERPMHSAVETHAIGRVRVVVTFLGGASITLEPWAPCMVDY